MRTAVANGIKLVHVSSDYVFDGTKTEPYTEDDPVAPLGVYGQTKATGDAIVATVPRHYIVRTSWVIGEGKNFVRTMASLAERGIGSVAPRPGLTQPAAPTNPSWCSAAQPATLAVSPLGKRHRGESWGNHADRRL